MPGGRALAGPRCRRGVPRSPYGRAARGPTRCHPSPRSAGSRQCRPDTPTDARFDLTIIGAGPAGLAAAVYAASEGIKTLVVEKQAVGGQAGTTSLIRNYPGFPRGVSGAKLAFRSFHQAWSLGAIFHFMRTATALRADGTDRIVDLSDGTSVRSTSVIVATGAGYRRLDVPALENRVGCDVFYGAA